MDLRHVHEAHSTTIKQLSQAIAKKQCAHALIFEGSQGSYGFELGLVFAQLLFCENVPCEECSHCKRIAHETHPNVHVVRPSKQFIVKDDILALQHDFNQKAVEEGPKIYIIDQAEKMNSQAANALLKFLEEPHPNLYGVLITEDASRLLPTLQSRSQRLTLPSLGKHILQDVLQAEGFERDDAALATALHAHVESAKAFLNDPLTQHAVENVTHLFERLAKQQAVLVTMQKEHPDLVKDKSLFERFIDVLVVYQKDVIYVKMEAEPRLVFQEHYEVMQKFAELKTLKQLQEDFNAMIVLRDRLQQPIHLPLAFDNLLIRMESRHNT